MSSPVVGLLAAAVFTSAIAEPVSDGRYSDQMFRDAVSHRQSTSQPFVLVTIIDASNGKEKKGCTEISALAAAIALEHGWTHDNPAPNEEKVDEYLLKTNGRRFAFYQARWLAGSGYYEIERNEKACSLLRQGVPAFRADLTGQIVAGSPGDITAGRPPKESR